MRSERKISDGQHSTLNIIHIAARTLKYKARRPRRLEARRLHGFAEECEGARDLLGTLVRFFQDTGRWDVPGPPLRDWLWGQKPTVCMHRWTGYILWGALGLDTCIGSISSKSCGAQNVCSADLLSTTDGVEKAPHCAAPVVQGVTHGPEDMTAWVLALE